MSGSISNCLVCIYLNDPVPRDPAVPVTCAAFPKGIPEEILDGAELHETVRADQNGDYTFLPEEGQDVPPGPDVAGSKEEEAT